MRLAVLRHCGGPRSRRVGRRRLALGPGDDLASAHVVEDAREHLGGVDVVVKSMPAPRVTKVAQLLGRSV
jgi:hypothetical protein